MHTKLIFSPRSLATIVGLALTLSIYVASQTLREPLLVLVIDSSPSVRPYWPEMQRAAQELIRNAPAQAAVAIVGIDAEARKSDIFAPARRSEAFAFIQSLRIGGKLTDLSRGTDAALALLQQADPARGMVVYLTDGKLVVPINFRQRGSFFELLRREFTPRRNIEVRVINVQGDQASPAEKLPSNVRFIPLASASELPGTIAGHLTAQIEEALGNAPAPLPSVAPSGLSANRQANWLTYGLPVTLLLLTGVAALIVRRRRKSRLAALAAANGMAGEPPPDVLREQDLMSSNEPSLETEPPVVLITASDGADRRGQMRRRLVHPGEQAIIGNNRFADLCLPGLRQARALQLRYDGHTFKVFRLRPQTGEELDDVKLNEAMAPVEFYVSEKDVLCVGDFRLNFLVTAADAVPDSWLRPESPPTTPIETLPMATRRRAALRGLGDQHYVNGES
jgi:hypothetical protein